MPKSPFVSGKQTETFTYPDPLDPENAVEKKLIDPEVAEEDPKPWIKVILPRSATEVDAVADYTQSVVTLAGSNGDGSALQNRIQRANRGIFELLVEGWSFTTGKPSGEDYDRLDKWAAVWVRTCLGEATNRGTSPDFPEPKPSSSPPAKSSPVALPAGSATE